MSDDPILRPEFDLYMKSNSELTKSLSELLKELTKENRENNGMIKEYILTNGHRVALIESEQRDFREVVDSIAQMVPFLGPIKASVIFLAGGALTALGVKLASFV